MNQFIIEETKNYPLIRGYVTGCPDLWERVKDDNLTTENYYPSFATWIGAFHELTGKCIGLLSFCEESPNVATIHIHIRKEHRGKRSFGVGNSMLKFFIKHRLPRIMKINAKIPVIYPDVIRYAEKNGFEREGLDRSSFLKNGVMVDRVILGMVLQKED